ncbi:hypothetical protein BGZ75_002966 [Mortierella antarctica]|nr:hypothetical protein BGZ75_002966 [Mortierella antarctica]
MALPTENGTPLPDTEIMDTPTENGTPLPDTEIRFISVIPETWMCIESTNGLQTPGNPVQLAECDFDKAREQQWEYDINGDILLSPSRAQNGSLYCLDIQIHSGTNKPDTVVNPCNNTPTQKWHIEELATFRIRNEETKHCLEAVEGVDKPDYRLTLSPCTELHSQQWSYLD